MTFIRFLLNGAILGALTFIVQFYLDSYISLISEYHQLYSSIVVIMPFILINFLSQKHFVFKRNGFFFRFLFANGLIMMLVSIGSYLINNLKIAQFMILDHSFNLSFVLASIICVPISFILKSRLVFNK